MTKLTQKIKQRIQRKQMMKNDSLRGWIYHVLIAIDQLFNAIIGGCADETLSSRTFRGAKLAQSPKLRWVILYFMINTLFFDKQHCKTAYYSELNRKQYPKVFWGK